MDVSNAEIVDLTSDEVDPSWLLHLSPISELLTEFEGEGQGALLVCGVNRVRLLIGSAGTPGVLPLLLWRYALAKPNASLCGLSVFFALPKTEDHSLPIIDVLDGLVDHKNWEECFVETFTDAHRILSVLVRLLSAAGERGGTSRMHTVFQNHIGCTPLIFRLILLESDANGPWDSEPGIGCRSLLMVAVPPVVPGGPDPSEYCLAAGQLRRRRCCVVNAGESTAASGSGAAGVLRLGMGPLQHLLDVPVAIEKMQEGAEAASHVPVHRLVGEHRSAVRDLAHLLTLQEQWQSGEQGPGLCQGQAQPQASEDEDKDAWRSCFQLRDISLAEVRRQLPLAWRRARSLHQLLAGRNVLLEADEGHYTDLEEALKFKSLPLEAESGVAGCPSDVCDPHSRVPVELVTMAWQQQWQAQELLGHLDVAEERNWLRCRVSKLERALAARLAGQGQAGHLEGERTERVQRDAQLVDLGHSLRGSREAWRREQSGQAGRAERRLQSQVSQLEEGRDGLLEELHSRNRALELSAQRAQVEATDYATAQKHIEELTNELSEVCAYACQLEQERAQLQATLEAARAAGPPSGTVLVSGLLGAHPLAYARGTQVAEAEAEAEALTGQGPEKLEGDPASAANIAEPWAVGS